MKRLQLVILFILIFNTVQALVWNGSVMPFRANGVDFGFVPYVTIVQNNHDVQLQFQTETQAVGDGYLQKFITREMRLELELTPYSLSDIPLWKCHLTAHFNDAMNIHDLWLNIYLDPRMVEYRGEKAMRTQSVRSNANLYPYTDRQAMYKSELGAIWFIGSNVLGENPVECIENKSLKCFDREFHKMDISYQTGYYFDWLPVHSGMEMSWDFALSEDSPPLIQINRYPKGKKAAYCITNDADCETAPRLQAVYQGSNIESDAAFGNMGLIKHGLVTSHTVFGENFPLLHNIWNTIRDSGSRIGYHTYSNEADNMLDLRYSLLEQMTEYDICTWIDHSYKMNPEAVYVNGWNPQSPYYLFPLFKEAGIKYFWMAETDAISHMDSFDLKDRLPHTVPALGLDYPLYLFKRWRTEAWEYYDTPQYDFKNNVTAENLDILIENRGMAVGYTHLCFNPNAHRQSFYYYSNGVFRCLEEADDCFEMLADYRDNNGLWICPSEDLFDRIIATEHVWMKSIQKLDDAHLNMTFCNSSDFDLNELEFSYQGSQYVITLLPAAGESSVIVQYSADWDSDHFMPPAPSEYFITTDPTTCKVRERYGKSMSDSKVAVYNLRGQRCDMPINYSSNNVEADMSKSGSGLYILKLEIPGEKTRIMKFIHHK